MKKGKSIKLNLFKTLKTSYGTVDSKELKSIYVNVQSWVSPKTDYDNWNRIVCNLGREIKHSVYDSIDKNVFQEKSIVDLDLRTSGLNYGKKSFFNLEINLFTNNNFDFKSQNIKDSVKTIVKSVFQKNIKNNTYFSFSPSKKIINKQIN
jgi:hypothetical protein